MERREQIDILNRMLLEEMPEYRRRAGGYSRDEAGQRRLLRSLMNLRPPAPLREEFLTVQDALLSGERESRGVVDCCGLPSAAARPQIALWQGDITRLKVDAIVNAGNAALLGCFCPCHGCIDNAIHSAAGLQLREECSKLMAAQGYPEPVGRAKLSKGYNLPARYVIHTVGPAVQGQVNPEHREGLAACYRACLELAAEHGLQSIAFCCISTGVFRFPSREAAEIAVRTTVDFLSVPSSIQKVIFNVYQDADKQIYRDLLGPDQAAETGP